MVIIPERSGLLLLKVVKYVSLPIHLLSTFAHFYTKIQTIVSMVRAVRLQRLDNTGFTLPALIFPDLIRTDVFASGPNYACTPYEQKAFKRHTIHPVF